MSDTPRTDELEYDGIGISNFGHQDLYYAYKFARTLERELNAANARIKRLEAAGDALANTQTYDLLETVNWREAKEANL